MELVVERLSDYATDIGLTEKALQAAAESRLRAARLYTEDSAKSDFAYLYVNVNVVGPAFNILVEYEKRVTDRFGRLGNAVTWNSGSTGTHGRDAGYTVQALSEHLDRSWSRTCASTRRPASSGGRASGNGRQHWPAS